MRIGAKYTIIMPRTSISAAKDLIRVSAPATGILLVTRAWIDQSSNASSEQLEATIQRATTDGTGSANTPNPVEVGMPAFPGTAVHNLTADTTAGVVLHTQSFNGLAGCLWTPEDDGPLVVPPSGRLVLRLSRAPAAARDFVAGLSIRFIG